MGFRHFMKKRAAYKALRQEVMKDTRRRVRSLIKSKVLRLTKECSLEAFRNMSFHEVVSSFKSEVPLLHDVLLGAMTRTGNYSESHIATLTPILGFILSILAHLFQDFNHLGICVGEGTLRSVLDDLRGSFDNDLKSWKTELQEYVFGVNDDPPAAAVARSPASMTSLIDSEDSLVDSGQDDDDWEDTDIFHDVSDVESCSEAERTILYGEEGYPPGYTLCWDNVGRQVKARHHTRNHGNQYQTWALAYAVQNRIPTTKFDDKNVVKASDIPLTEFVPSNVELQSIRKRLINMVMRVLKETIPTIRSNADCTVEYHIQNAFSAQSKDKSTMFNIGIIEDNPASIPGVISILDKLHAYVPTDGHRLFKIVTWGDGLSCERHVDSQNARANARSPRDRLEGLEPSPQEFHKRMLLLQDTMDQMFSGKSATDKGTLFHLKNVFNQRSVKANVYEAFNHVSEFLHFVTEGYISLFAMQKLGIQELDDEINLSQEEFEKAAEDIVQDVWNPVDFQDGEEEVASQQCFCKQDGNEDDDEPMIKCCNEKCPNEEWFHYECVGISEESVPDDTWYCSKDCKKASNIRHRPNTAMVECCHSLCTRGVWFHFDCVGLDEANLPGEDDAWYCSTECKKLDKNRGMKSTSEDMKYMYTKKIVWAGLSDMVRRDAVRYNDGPMMLLYWKSDLAVNGWQTERVRNDLMWNRTVNIHGGAGSNIEADLVNEFLNREFKDSMRSVGSKATSDTLARHGTLAGGLGKEISKIYAKLVERTEDHPGARKMTKREEDIKFFVNLLKEERLTENCGRLT
ncbi:YNG1-like protein [Mya arenaria]|uniref:YNG1-like protein n=1 Tax=Mya arenaria TaxID=6604 RepID=A0ABY7EFP0_MYAAR|nr:YNG1-like protein [Mya arenaria]